MYVCMYVCMIPGLKALTSVSSAAEVRASVLRPLNRYNLSLERSTMYVPADQMTCIYVCMYVCIYV